MLIADFTLQIYNTRLFRIHGIGSTIHLEPVPLSVKSLDPRYTFILDAGLTIYIWYSAQSVNTLKSKSRYSISLLNVVITINILKF